ncbi:MAG: HD domain-containing protein [Candidatus Paceibacterota bacterium]
MKNQCVFYQAIELANWTHREQRRKVTKTPYVVHPLHGVTILLTHGVSLDDPDGLDILVAEVLHDGPEDNVVDCPISLIESLFGREVARIVSNVTLDHKNPDKQLSRQKILGLDWKTRIVKTADVMSNTVSTVCNIERFGLREVLKHSKKPIARKIAMEREFLSGVCREGDPVTLIQLQRSALRFVDKLAELTSTAHANT